MMVSLFVNALKTQLVYRANFFGYIFLVALAFSIKFLYIDGIFNFTESLGGYSQDEVVFLIYLSALIGVISDTFDKSVLLFYRQLALGKIEPFLTQPRSIFSTMMFRWSKIGNVVLVRNFRKLWI